MWLSSFFHEAFVVVPPLGLAAFAMLVSVALVAVYVTISKANPALIAALAIISIVVMLGLNQLWGGRAYWVDTGAERDWGGKDRFYGAGAIPVNEADGRTLCDKFHLGKIATCWESRPADTTSMDPNVPTHINISEKRLDWCAYKDVTLAIPANGHATPGKVYVCGQPIYR